MNIRDVGCFLAIMEHGSLQRAAAYLGLTQPALTKCVHRLEKSLNATLFVRGSGGMAPTPAALALKPYAVRLEGEYNAAFDAIGSAQAGEVAKIRVGVTPAWEPLVSKAFEHFSASRPATRLDLSLLVSHRLVRALRGGQIDIGVVTAESVPPDVHSRSLGTETLLVVAHRTHPVHRLPEPALKDVQDCDWLVARPGVQSRDQLEAAFAQAGLGPVKVKVEVDGTGMRPMLPMVARMGLLGACQQSLSSDMAALGLRPVPIEALRWPMVPRLVFRADSYLSPVTQAFIDTIQQLSEG